MPIGETSFYLEGVLPVVAESGRLDGSNLQSNLQPKKERILEMLAHKVHISKIRSHKLLTKTSVADQVMNLSSVAGPDGELRFYDSGFRSVL